MPQSSCLARDLAAFGDAERGANIKAAFAAFLTRVLAEEVEIVACRPGGVEAAKEFREKLAAQLRGGACCLIGEVAALCIAAAVEGCRQRHEAQLRC